MSLTFSPNNCWYKQVCPRANTSDCSYACGKFSAMSFLVSNSGLPEKLQVANKMFVARKDKEAYERLADIKTNIDDFVREGRNLFIWSESPGNGKTTWSSRLLMAYFSTLTTRKVTTVRGKFVSVTDFLQTGTQYKQADSFIKLFNQVCNADLVVFDDIGVFELSANETKILYNVINTRISNGRSNIFTSNQAESGLSANIGDHLTSRIWNTSEIIEFKSKDVRNSV